MAWRGSCAASCRVEACAKPAKRTSVAPTNAVRAMPASEISMRDVVWACVIVVISFSISVTPDRCYKFLARLVS